MLSIFHSVMAASDGGITLYSLAAAGAVVAVIKLLIR
jgi:hypothetical protein